MFRSRLRAEYPRSKIRLNARKTCKDRKAQKQTLGSMPERHAKAKMLRSYIGAKILEKRIRAKST